jgi:hypothetical protein
LIGPGRVVVVVVVEKSRNSYVTSAADLPMCYQSILCLRESWHLTRFVAKSS